MKLLRLEIHNIASIGDSAIDFENGLLAQEPLFLICGETGAGKSTILNCICMALYNKVPTMPNTKDKFDAKTTIGDTKNFLRKDTGEGYIHLFFEESEKKYEAEWTLHRSHNKPDGNLQNVERILTDTDNGSIIASKANEVDANIREIIGLDFDQFTRMFMLAQGQFNKFLTADEREKSEILQSLTKMDVYEQIGRYIHEREVAEDSSLTKIKQQIEYIHLLTDEEKSENERLIAEYNGEIKELSNTVKIIDNKLAWCKSYTDANVKFAEARESQIMIQLSIDSDKNKKRTEDIQLWDATGELRQYLNDINKAKAAIENNQKAINNGKVNFTDYLSSFNRAKSELSVVESSLKKSEDILESLKPDSSMYENVQTIMAGLKSVAQLKTTNNKLHNGIETINSDLIKLNDNLSKLKSEADAAEANENDLKRKRDDKRDEINAADKKGLQAKRDKLTDEIAEIEAGKSKWDVANKITLDLQKVEKEIEQITADITGLQKEKASADKRYDDACKEYELRKHDFDTKKLTIDECAGELRKSLVEGEPCPICGSKHHEVKPETVFKGLYDKANEELAKAEKEKSEASQALTRLKTQIEQKEKELKKVCDETLPNLKKDKSTADNEWKLYADKYAANTPFINCPDVLKTAGNGRHQQKFALDEKIKSIEKSEAMLNQLQKDYEAAMKNTQNKKNSYTEQQNIISQKGQNIKNYTSQIDNNRKSIDNTMNSLQSMITWHDWQQWWNQDGENFEKDLLDKAEQYKNCKENLPILRASVDKIKTNVESAEKSIALVYSLIPAWQDVRSNNISQKYRDDLSVIISTFLEKLRGLTEQKKLNESDLTALENRKLLLVQAYQDSHPQNILDEEELNRMQSMNDSIIAGMHKESDKLKNDLSESDGKIKQIKETIWRLKEQETRLKEGETDNNLKEEKANKENIITEKQQKVGSLQEQIKANEKHNSEREGLLAKRDTQKKIYDNWADLDNLFGNDRFSKAAQRITFRFLLEKANLYLQKLYPRYNLGCAPDSFALVVEDYEMGTSRPCTTLSGGESFIVSLALALGLSSLSDEKIKVDTLFIDEGFGTLSSEYLDTVMQVLEGLQKTGRKVGIISHVEILRERIPAQIQVIRKNRTESEIKVVMA